MANNSREGDDDNPLLRHIASYDSIEEVGSALYYNFLADEDLATKTTLGRHELLMGEKVVVTPTDTVLRTACTIIGMHRRSLIARNPYIPANRAWVHRLIEDATDGTSFVGGAPMPGACALVVKGITGTRKSITVKRVLKMLGPQVVPHGSEERARWKQAIQINWLYVAISHDGSRGGLLIAILIAIDQALGTNHAVRLPRDYPSIEKLVGAVIALLHSHYVGVLVIDEIQLLNLYLADQATLMQLLLLNFMNSGIPTVLVGNPLGFIWLAEYSQDASRLVERPQIYFHPCGAIGLPEQDEWDQVWAGIRLIYVLRESPLDVKKCKAVVKRCSGGIPRLALALWTNTQAEALLGRQETISPEHIEAEFKKEAYDAVRGLCSGFANRDPIALLPWRGVDVPVDYYALEWGKPLPTTESEPETTPSQRGRKARRATKAATAVRGTSGLRSMKAQEARQKARDAAADAAKHALSSEDMRMNGIKEHSLAALHELMKGNGKT